MEPCIKRKIVKVSGSASEEVDDLIAVERQIVISVNNNKVLSLYCTPTMIKEFVVGFLLNEGVINGHFCADSMAIENRADMSIQVNVTADGQVSTEGLARTTVVSED